MVQFDGEIRIDTLEQQVDRAYTQFLDCDSDLRKNSFLQSLKCELHMLLFRPARHPPTP